MKNKDSLIQYLIIVLKFFFLNITGFSILFAYFFKLSKNDYVHLFSAILVNSIIMIFVDYYLLKKSSTRKTFFVGNKKKFSRENINIIGSTTDAILSLFAIVWAITLLGGPAFQFDDNPINLSFYSFILYLVPLSISSKLIKPFVKSEKIEPKLNKRKFKNYR